MDRLEADTSADLAAQSARILAHLQTGKAITAIEALRNFGCFRLAARIYDLRKEGHSIVSMPPDGQHVAYLLKRSVEGR